MKNRTKEEKMNNRFKFRVWDMHHNTYSVIPYGNYALSSRGELFWRESNRDCSEINTEDLIIEQYTGLKDKNGRLIYEGDIVFLNDEKWHVIWSYEDCAFFFLNLKEVYHQPIFPDFYMMANDVKVIGNIHENPELQE